MSKFRNPSQQDIESFNKELEFDMELSGYLLTLFRLLREKKKGYPCHQDITFLEFLLQMKYDDLYLINPKRTLSDVPRIVDIVWK